MSSRRAAAMILPSTILSSGPEPRRQALRDSLRLRWVSAMRRDDAAAKQALFKEAVYLGIQPGDYQLAPGAAELEPGAR